MNSVEKGSEKTSVQVVLRIRPITDEDTTNLPTRFQRQVLTTSPYTPNQVIVNDKKPLTFNFDHVFGPETKQHEIFEDSIFNLIDQFLEGYNVTILAYGQTSSGKTHTMGTLDNSSIPSESKGIIPRAMDTLFSYMNSSQYKTRQFSIKVSFVEIYNEELIDLLGEQIDESRPQVMIREDSKGNILWSGLQEVKVNSVDEVMTNLARGSLNRQVGATDMNSQSSRSHAIFSVIMSQQKCSNISSTPMSPSNSNSGSPKSRPPSRSQQRISRRLDDVENVTIISKFNFVDLAGSERLKRTSAIGDRVKEGISINSGLLALGNVISALGDPNKAKHTTHIPYRDSKLTRLLQDSLGGNAQTLMIACVSPTEYNLSETINTLKYANRARNIKNSAIINQEETGWNDLEHLQSLVMKLRFEIKSLKSSSSNNSNSENFYDDNTDSGRSTPIHFQKGDSSKRSSLNNVFTHSDAKLSLKKDKDIELLEEQLQDLQRSYSELSQRYAMTSAELALHQDIVESTQQINGQSSNQLDVITEEDEDLSSSIEFRKAVEPIIEEYERSITSLESQLALSRAAASHTETIMQDQESKLEYADQINEQNFDLINDLKGKVGILSQRDTVNEQYIKELEFRLENYTKNQNKDQDMINELKNTISHLKSDGTNTQSYITDLETRLTSSDQEFIKFSQTVEKLEKRLQQREEAFRELELKLKSSYTEDDIRLLQDKLDDRDHRISQLEKKVDELINELELLRRLKDNDKKSNLTSENKSNDLISKNNNNQENLIASTLEEKLEELEQVNEQTINEFNEIKIKYEECLQEIHELQSQLIEARLNHPDLFDSFPSSPITPISPSTPSPNSLRTSLPYFNKEGNKDALAFINAMIASKQMLHRKAISLSTEMINKEKKDLTHELIVQKLQKEIQQLESLHEDKSSGLEVFKEEFSRLDTAHRETLEVVEELREEIKRRDTLAQFEVMSVMTSDYHTNGEILGVTNETDEFEIIKRLREEVENLREEQKRLLKTISEREKEIREKGIQVVKLVSNIRELREKLYLMIEEDQKKSNENNEENKKLINELQTKVKDLEQQLEKAKEQHEQDKESEKSENDQQNPEEVDEEIVTLKLKVKELQAEIEAKSHTIAVLLLPTIELQDVIRKLEVELQEVKQVHHKVLEENNSETTINENEIITSDENVKDLEDKIKNLESQLTKAKEAQYLRISRITMKPTRKDGENLQQENLSSQSDNNEQKLITELQSELDKLKFDIKEKYELIETLKKDLIDKDVIQQKLREKEAEASSLRLQLSEVKNRDEEMQEQIKQLRIEIGKGTNDALKSELESVKKELRNSKEKESFAIERLKMLDAEETKIRQEMKRLRHVELLQKERITVLESRFSRQSFGRFNDDVFKLKNELESSKETEKFQQKKITDLESKLEKSVREFNSLRTKIDYVKSKILVNRNSFIERENDLVYSESSIKTKKLREEIKSLQAQETEHLKKIETLEAQLVLIQKDNNVTSLKDELSELRNIKFNLEKSVQDLESKLSIAQKETEKLKNINDEIKLLKELDSEQKSTIERLQVQLKETTLDKNSVIKELESVKKDFGSQKEIIFTLENELNDVKVELNIATEKHDSSLKKLEDLSKTLKDTRLQRDEKVVIIKELEDEIEQLRISTTSGQKDITLLQNQLTNSKHEMGTQNELLAKLGTQMMKIEKERDQYASRIAQLTDVLEFKEIEQKEAVSSLESVIANLRMQLVESDNSSQSDMKTIKRLRDKLATVEAQLKRAKVTDQKRSHVINELETQLEETNQTLNEKEELLSTQNNLIQELEMIVQQTQIKLENAKKSEAIEYKRGKELEMELDEFKAKYEGNNLGESNSGFNKIKNELEKVKNSEIKQAELVKTLELQLQEAIINRDQEISKLQEATAEIEDLKRQCDQLRNQINKTNETNETNDSSKQNQKNTDNTDNSLVKDLTKQLEEARTESKAYRDRVEELENQTKQLESDKTDQIKTNTNLLQQVEQLQKELESLAEEFSDPTSKNEEVNVLSNEQKKSENETKTIKERRTISFKRNSFTKKSKNKDDESSNLAFAKLTEVNNSLRKTNENLTSKILQAQTRMNTLSEKIKHLESELMSIRLFENNISHNNDESVNELKEKIRELETEKEQASSASSEERSKHDQKIKSLLQQLESIGKGGNETATQISALNNKIIELENEISTLKQQSTTDTAQMEKEIAKLVEINDKLGKEVQKSEIKSTIKRNSMPPQELESISSTVKERPRTTSLDGSIKTKLLQQENTITEQENLIKTLKEKIFELETRTGDETSYEVSLNSGILDLDAVGAVGGFRISTKSSEAAMKKNKKSNVATIANYPITPPPTPPPSHSLSSLLMASSPTNSGSRSPTRGFGTLSPPPRNFNSPTPGFDINNAQPAELVMEIQKLYGKISKMEGENIENNDQIGNLESTLKENETNLRVAKQQLQILQREKMDLSDQIKKLRSQLDETTVLFENTKSSVQEEKKVIENVLEEERRAKENAEKAKRQLESQMEELMVSKKSKFMCF